MTKDVSRFTAVIEENNDGSRIFRTDLVRIDFPVDGLMVSRVFWLEDQMAPIIPFSLTGAVTEDQLLFAVDQTGSAWVEEPDGEMRNFTVAALMIKLLDERNPQGDALKNLLVEVEETR